MAENNNSLQGIITNLENLFRKFNRKYFNGELQKPIITVSPDTTNGAYGWCTSWKASVAFFCYELLTVFIPP